MCWLDIEINVEGWGWVFKEE